MMRGTGRGTFALSDENNPKSARAAGRRVADMMIDQSATAARQQPVQEDDASLDEARLRQQAIGVKLRQMFDQVVNEPVPDEFLEILRRADQRTAARKC
jgi:Anti-sigma factor NepR